MNLFRRKLKNLVTATLSITLCTTLTASCATINYTPAVKPDNGSGANSEKVEFTDVTDKFDTRNLSISNFNDSVIKNDSPEYETRTVIVTLSGQCILDLKPEYLTVSEYLGTQSGQAALKRIEREQNTFLSKLSSHRIEYTLKNTYSTVTNSVAIEIDTSKVAKIKGFGGVESASIAQTYLVPETEQSSSGGGAVSNNANVYETGIYNSDSVKNESWGTGAGMLVAVIDTGLDYTHEAFQTTPESYRMTKDGIADRLANTVAYGRMSLKGVRITADDVYISEKVPFAFDYADNDTDVYPSYSNHGTHVAGIIGGQADSYDNKDGEVAKDENGNILPFRGVAPDAQLMICKTFTDNLDSSSLGGAESESIMAALEDCVNVGVDVINMSLGSTAGFTTTDDGDDEGETYNAIFKRIQNAGISLICAASNDYSAGFGSAYGTNLASNPDSGTVGSPSTYFAALSVASISGQQSEYLLSSNGDAIFFDNASNGSGTNFDFVEQLLGEKTAGAEKTFKYVVAGLGQQNDYRGAVSRYIQSTDEPVLALVKRGVSTFQEKIEIAKKNGAAGVIVWNNVSGTIRMSLGDLSPEERVPAISITNDAGNALIKIANDSSNRISGEVIVSTRSAGPFMSEFSSWGSTSDLKIKPEITAHGGEITSTVPGGYAEQSGTSMASPNMAGLTALVRNYVKTDLSSLVEKDGNGGLKASSVTQITNQLIMSTATIAHDQNNLPYSPRKQGAGLATLSNIVDTKALLFTDDTTSYWYSGKDNRPKVELGEDEDKVGVYTFDFKIKNFGSTPLSFKPKARFMTETRATGDISVSVKEQAHILDDVAPVFTFNGQTAGEKITVAAGKTATIGVTLKLSAEEKKYLDDSFVNGMFVEGFISLEGEGGQCDLTLPFLGFYGDWEAAPMLDYTAYEVAEFEKDSSYTDETRPHETIWATQPFASYNEENYIIPLGSYLYAVDPSETPMYANMEYCSVSRFNEIISEDGIGNYATAYNIRCLYAGLLRNAQRVNYKMTDAYTGEVITTGVKNRISKAYASGGSARPAYVELKLSPEELGLVSNGKYTFEFEFLFHKDDVLTEEQRENSVFSFDFYVDYEAPVLQDARVRYYNYTENNTDKQRIYLDLDVFDNHYAQSVMLLYVDSDGEKQELKLATDYITPIRNANKNGVTTVSLDVTDIWDDYKDILALQFDDYALNHSVYVLGNLSSTGSVEERVNSSTLPDKFELAEGEDNITLAINEAHKVSLVYEGSADLSNFGWRSASSRYVAVKNGEIVGVSSTHGRAYSVSVTNYKGVTKTINVTVTDNTVDIKGVSFKFGVIENYNEALVKADGSVSVYAGEDIPLEIVPTPWYYPMGKITNVKWESNLPEIATVDENGIVHTRKKGSVSIKATITAGGTVYYTSVELGVRDEFTVSNMSLTRYRGEGEDYVNPNTGETEHNVVIVPSEKAIMSIGDEAFKDNTVIKKIIVPDTVTQISKSAFEGCTALEEVYFQTDKAPESDDYVHESDLTLIEKYAFKGCTSLKLLDLTYCKVFTVARETFMDCVNLSTIRNSAAIGTAYDRAFMGCSSLEEFDASGLHSTGANVFSGCTSLRSVTSAKFTSFGADMFAALEYYYPEYDYKTGEWKTSHKSYDACNSLKKVTVNSLSVGTGAFRGCENLEEIVFSGQREVRVGNGAFENCTKLSKVSYENGSTVKSFGDRCFAGCTALTSFTLPDGLETLGAGVFDGSGLLPSSDGTTVTADGEVISADGKTLIYYFGSATEYVLPQGIVHIGAYAFANSSVESVVIPQTVKTIGEGAFRESKLSSIRIDANLASVPDYAFRNTLLSSVTLPSTVTFVGDGAFSGCAQLTAFNYAPSAYATFGDSVFSGCTALTEIALDAKITAMGDTCFFGCIRLEKAALPALTELGQLTFFNTPSLKEVKFNQNAKVTGDLTFAAYAVAGTSYPATRSALTSVTFGSSVEKIGEGIFFNCIGLTEINLSGATVVGNDAFNGATALATVIGLDGVKTIGDYAFANTRLTSLNLSEAVTIGDCAFMIERGRAYTQINILKAKAIGERAFYGNNVSEVNIPATLETVGNGAFAASASLKKFTVDGANKIFFADGDALYRKIDGKYALVQYPAGKSVEEYAVIDNTARIDGRAFEGHRGRIGKVILPYSLKSVGPMAFFNSGITVYEFKGVTAPALEEEYSEFIDEYIDSIDVNFRGYYYANFENYFIYYSDLGSGVTTKPLTIYRPSNGTGYTNPVYSAYFLEKHETGIAMSEATNSFVTQVRAFPEAAEIAGWNTSNKTEKFVRDFSQQVKLVHEYYNAFRNDAAQLELVDESLITKFTDVESALRKVKPLFNISVTVSRLETSGNFKTVYKIGEKFDMTGLQIVIVYDDYSTELADMSKVTLVSPTGELGELDRTATFSVEGISKTASVRITVTEEGEPVPVPPENEGGCGGGCGSVSSSGGTILFTFTVLGVMIFISNVARKRNRGRK